MADDPQTGVVQQPIAPQVQEPVVTSAPAPQAPITPQVQQPAAPVIDPYTGAQSYTGQNDRTREQFAKLLESNRRLNEELQRRAAQNTQIPQAPAPQPQVDPRDFIEVDPISGQEFINEQKLKSRLEDVTQRAGRAEQMVQTYIQASEQREIDRQNKETYASYPELNPDVREQFNPEFARKTRQVLTDAFMNPQDYGGRPLSFKEAADLVRRESIPSQPQVVMDNPLTPAPQVQVAQPTAPTGQEIKQQVTAEVANQPAALRDNVSDDELSQKLSRATRYGDDEALAIRLKLSDHTRQASSDED